jgi:hypothetical protein
MASGKREAAHAVKTDAGIFLRKYLTRLNNDGGTIRTLVQHLPPRFFQCRAARSRSSVRLKQASQSW